MSKPLSAPRKAAFDLPALPALDGETRQAWVYRQLREAIMRHSEASGMRLPSSRALAERLQVSRSTVEVAFDQLRAEGYVSGITGSGTYVSATLPDSFLHPRAVPPGLARGPRATPVQEPVPTTLRRSMRGDAFAARVADATLFPIAQWRRRLVAAARTAPKPSEAENSALGTAALRSEVARYVSATRGIACQAEQVVIVSGIRQGLDLCGRVLLQPADKVLLEDPGYTLASDIFKPYTRKMLPVAIDEAGFSVTRARRHTGVRLVHVTPAHQSPTGIVMPVSRRLELLSWAQEHNVWLVEDDYDSEFNYRSAPLPALKSLDKADRVIHCGSFNKTMFVDLRIGYMVVPQALIPAFAAACRATGSSVGLLEQRALASFIADGELARHVRRSRAVYARRRDRVLTRLRKAVAPAPLRTTGEHGGFHFSWWLPDGLPATELLAQAAARGLVLEDMATFCRRARMAPGVSVGDSAVSDELLEDALDRLCAAITAAAKEKPL